MDANTSGSNQPDIETMIRRIEQRREKEEQLIASLERKVAAAKTAAMKAQEEAQEARLAYDKSLRIYEKDMLKQAKMEKKLDEAATVIMTVRDHMVAVEKMLNACDLLKNYLVSSGDTETKEIDTLEAELQEMNFDMEFENLEKMAVALKEKHKMKKEYCNQQIESLVAQLDTLVESHKVQKLKFQNESDSKLKTARESNAILRSKVEKGAAELELIKKEVADRKAELESKKRRNEEMDATIKEQNKSFNDELSRKRVVTDRLREKLAAKKLALEKQNKANEVKSKEIAKLKEDVGCLQSSNADLKKRKKIAEETIDRNTERISKLEIKNAGVLTTIENKRSAKSKLQEEIESKEREIETIKKENEARIQKALEEERIARDNLEAVERRMQDVNAKRTMLEDVLRTMNPENLRSQLDEVNKENQELTATNQNLRALCQEKEKSIENHSRQLQELNCDIKKKQQELHEKCYCWTHVGVSIKSAIEDKTISLEAAKEKLEEVKIATEKRRDQLAKAKEELAKVLLKKEMDCREVEEKQKKLEAAKKEVTDLKKEKADMGVEYKKVYRDLIHKYKEKSEALRQSQANLNDLFRKCTKLEENVAHTQSLLAQTIQKDNKQLMRDIKTTLAEVNVDEDIISPPLRNLLQSKSRAIPETKAFEIFSQPKSGTIRKLSSSAKSMSSATVKPSPANAVASLPSSSASKGKSGVKAVAANVATQPTPAASSSLGSQSKSLPDPTKSNVNSFKKAAPQIAIVSPTLSTKSDPEQESVIYSQRSTTSSSLLSGQLSQPMTQSLTPSESFSQMTANMMDSMNLASDSDDEESESHGNNFLVSPELF